MRKIKFAAVLLAPSIVLSLYVLCMQSLKLFTNVFASNWPGWLAETGLNVIIGIYLFVLCKHGFRTIQPGKVRAAYPLSILLVTGFCLLTLIPAFDLKMLNYFLLGCLPQFAITATLNLGIFVNDCYLKMRN